MCRKLMMLGATLLMFGCMALAADTAFMGVVSDSHCGAKHSTAGDDAAACVGKCVAGGATYVLAASDGAGLLAIGLSDRWRSEGLGPVRSEIARTARVPTLFARRGLRPGVLAPSNALTRFTWSVAGPPARG